MMLGHLMEWFYSGIAGIRQLPDAISYNNILIMPEIVGDLTWAEATFKTVHGEIISSWKIENDKFILKVAIPVNCKAEVVIPQADPWKITENGKTIHDLKDIKMLGDANGKTRCEISSGEYLFQAQYIK
jgi:hypothetical protein